MPNRSSKHHKPADLNRLASAIVGEAVSDAPPSDKNPAAVELGRAGGLVGGKARAASLSPERRKEIAEKAAAARWAKKESSE